MKAPLVFLLLLFVFASAPFSHSQEIQPKKSARIGRHPGHDERKRQANEERRAASEEAAPTPRFPVVSNGFAGMDFNDSNPQSPSHGSVPPDTHAATGPNSIVATVNTAFSIYNRANGTLISGPNDLNDFFGLNPQANHSLSDPVVAYDELLGRFFIGLIDFGANDPPTSSDLWYAVSDDANPTGPASFSHQTKIRVDHGGSFACTGATVVADFTRVGWNADAHVFSFNMFDFTTNCFDGVRIVVIDKSTIDTGLVFYRLDRNQDHFTMAPATMHGSVHNDPMWFVEEDGFANGTRIRVVKLTDVLGTQQFADTSLNVSNYGFPPNAPQKGGIAMDTGDTRVLNAEWRGGRLVAAQTVGLTGPQARWYEFNTTGGTPTLTQQGTIVQGSAATYYPSIAIAQNGDLGLTFMQSSSKQFVSMYVTGQILGDALGTMHVPLLAKAGERTYVAFDCTSKDGCRAGDFSGITVDPDLFDTFCAANEYATSSLSENWGTWVSCFNLVPNHDLAVTAMKAPKSLAGAGASGGDVVGTVTVTIQNRSDHNETVADQTVLGNLVQLNAAATDTSGEGCIDGVVQLDPVATPALFSGGPRILVPGATLTVTFRVTYHCSTPLPKKGDLSPADYTHTATVHHDALPGGLPDEHPADDVCPHAPLGFDPNPPPFGTTDKGCGAKKPPGGPVTTNIIF
jgi:hypothetical protein